MRSKDAFIQKALPVIGYICVAAALILSLLEMRDVNLAPKPVAYALFGVFFLSQSLTQENSKKKLWSSCLTVGWFLVALMHCF